MTEKTTGSGALVQLAAYGSEDLILTSDPNITYFKTTHKRHSNFSMESIELKFIDIPQFNGTNVITIRKNGDLVNKLYLELTLPYDSNLTDSYWTNRVGFNLLKKVELYIGKNLIDRLYGLWMHIWVELTHKKDMKQLIDEMVGTSYKGGYSMGLPCNVPHKLQIPLFFSFNRNEGSAIPLNAIRNNQEITLKFFFEKKENCIQIGEMPSGNLSNVSLWADYIFLETEDNRLYVQKPLEYLIEVTQHLERNLITGGVKSIALPFTLPCKEIMWAVSDIKKTGDKFTDFTFGSNSMVKDVQFKFDSKNVFSSGSRDNNYFNYVQAYQHHKGCPDLGINCYSFSIYPEDLSPSGIVNFKHLSTAVMNINTFPNGYINIFGFCYNILKINQGDVELVYRF